MIDLAVAILLAGLTSVWRFYDGGDKGYLRQKHILAKLTLQTSTPAVLCLIAALWAIYPLALQPDTFATLLISGLVFYLLIRGMPGWDHFLPHTSLSSGKKHSGMLLTYALPTLACGVAAFLFDLSALGSILLALSGLVPCFVYVLGSRLEERNQWPFRLTSEQCGRLSFGALVFPLPLL